MTNDGGRPLQPSGDAALDQHGHRRIQTARTINALRGLLKVLRPRLWNINKLLRIAINQREPRTLDLNHHPMSAPERVINIGHLEVDRGWLIRRHRLGLFKAVAELSAKRLAVHQLLITAHLYSVGRNRLVYRRGRSHRSWIVARVDVNQLHDEIGIGPGSRNV